MSTFRIYSWNVNGLRSAAKQGFTDWLGKSGGDVVALQEVRSKPEQLPKEVQTIDQWHAFHSPAQRPGYSGVSIYARQKPEQLHTLLNREELDIEGRLQIAHFGKLVLVNGYFPNGSGKMRDNSRVPYKLDFYQTLFKRLDQLHRQKHPIIVVGDFNVAHHEIDLARPKANVKTSGFLPEERAEFSRWIDAGWVDTFRHFDPNPHQYTWWSQRGGSRERNVGWRIDYSLANEYAMRHVRSSKIHADVLGSDHCPISIELDVAALNG